MLRLQRCSAFKSSWSSRRSFSISTPAKKYPRNRRALVLASSVAAVVSYLAWLQSSRNALASQTLSSSHFIPVRVESCETANHDTKVFTLIIPSHRLPPLDEHSFAPIWSICVKDDDIQVERPYTPLHGLDNTGRMMFWIKRYPDGEVGRWLHSKKAGDTIEIRGPLETWKWEDGIWDDVIMISGGTGITPMYQLLHKLLIGDNASNDSKTRFTLLHSSRSPADLPPPIILQPLESLAATQPDRFRMHLFVDHVHNPGSSQGLHVGRIDERAIKRFGLGQEPSPWWREIFSRANWERRDRKIIFIVCGPAPMISAIAGPFGRGFTQGPVGGVLGNMGYSSQDVWKL